MDAMFPQELVQGAHSQHSSLAMRNLFISYEKPSSIILRHFWSPQQGFRPDSSLGHASCQQTRISGAPLHCGTSTAVILDSVLSHVKWLSYFSKVHSREWDCSLMHCLETHVTYQTHMTELRPDRARCQDGFLTLAAVELSTDGTCLSQEAREPRNQIKALLPLLQCASSTRPPVL